MTRYHGNDVVKGGFYWAPARWEITNVPTGGGTLPGGPEIGYMRLPVVLLMVLGPLMGALFVMFLPFIGFALVGWFGGMKLIAAARRAMATAVEQED